MAGFCLEIRTREAPPAGAPLRLVDLGGSDREQTFAWGAVRLAWSFRSDSRQWWTRHQHDRLLLIEGHPDRHPAAHESLEQWLSGGRWGSFRGLEVRHNAPAPAATLSPAAAKAEALIFVDPLGTRPLYFHRTADRLLVSDKLATIALNAGGDAANTATSSAPAASAPAASVPAASSAAYSAVASSQSASSPTTSAPVSFSPPTAAASSPASPASAAEINWPAVLEAMTLGSLYTTDTTLHGVEELAAGETVAFRGVEIVRRQRAKLPADADCVPGRVREDPAGTLLAALEKAVAETWDDRAVWLLLSGGLDSRFVLALAGQGRKTVTLHLIDGETEIARDVAACCQAEFRVFPHDRADFLRSAQLGVALGGAMHDPHFFNHLGLGAKWRGDGVAAVTHAYLFDTLLKGYFLLPAGGVPQSALAGMMPAAARFFEQASGRASPFAAVDVLGLLSAHGREALQTRLAALEASLPVEIRDGHDLTFENRVLGRISRQIHYGTLLGWCEELDVVSPIFHPALWSWRQASRVRDRAHGRAFIQALLSLDHGILRVADANTGAPPRLPAVSWRDAIRNSRLYQAFLRPLRASVAGSAAQVTFPSRLGDRFRQPDALRFLTESIGEIQGLEWFAEAAIDDYLTKFRAGQDRYLEPLLACASAGRWRRIVRDRTADLP